MKYGGIKSRNVQKYQRPIPWIEIEDLTEAEQKNIVYNQNQGYLRKSEILYKVDFRGTIYQVVDKMPMFPACDSSMRYEEQKKCADKAMLDFIYSNVKYPTISRENGVEGTAVVSFIVEKDGSISRTKIIRDPGAGCGDEALRVVKLLPNFEPGKNYGKPVRVQFNLPVRFRLE